MVTSREIRLKSRPIGMPSAENFDLATVTVPDPAPGEVQVKNIWMTVDPYMRGRMVDRASYVPPFKLGEPLQGGAGAGDHRLLGLREVQHDIGDRPAGCRRRRRPLRAVEAAEDLLQPVLLRLKVVKDGHAWTMPPRPRLRPGRGAESRAFVRFGGTGLRATL